MGIVVRITEIVYKNFGRLTKSNSFLLNNLHHFHYRGAVHFQEPSDRVIHTRCGWRQANAKCKHPEKSQNKESDKRQGQELSEGKVRKNQNWHSY